MAMAERFDDEALEAMFAAARSAAAEPSADLLARVLADAEAVQDGRAALATGPVAAPRGGGGIWASILAALGGWGGAGGLAAAGLAGLWIGFAGGTQVTDTLGTLTGGLVGSGVEADAGVDLLPDLGSFALAGLDVEG